MPWNQLLSWILSHSCPLQPAELFHRGSLRDVGRGVAWFWGRRRNGHSHDRYLQDVGPLFHHHAGRNSLWGDVRWIDDIDPGQYPR